jgi:hypothetical protein
MQRSHCNDIKSPENCISVAESPSVVERISSRQGPPNRYCACTNLMCNCCREFSLAVVPIKGPGELNCIRLGLHSNVCNIYRQVSKFKLKKSCMFCDYKIKEIMELSHQSQ